MSKRQQKYLYASVDISSLNGTPKDGSNLSSTYELFDASGDDPNELRNLSKVNIFVGPNNSGKSRFMRKLFSSKQDRIFPAAFELSTIQNTVTTLHEKVKKHLKDQMLDFKEVPPEGIPPSRLNTGINYLVDLDNYREQIVNGLFKASGRRNANEQLSKAYIDQVRGCLQGFVDEAERCIHVNSGRVNQKLDIAKAYIPTLRGLRHLSNNLDVYKDSTVKEYFPGETLDENTHSIVTGLGLYDELKRMLLGNLSKRKTVRDFEEFLQSEFFEGKPVTLIPALGAELNVKIDNEQEQPIHHLGDGLQQIIIITFAAFSAENEHVNIYIEEPELYLHPGMQRRLLEVMTSEERFSNIQFYFTTHSNHLLDMTMDFESISVYNFRKEIAADAGEEVLPTFSVTNVSNDDLNLLTELGVQNSSVFLANCTIWVEGPTDRQYIRHYLKLYYEHLDEQEQADESEQSAMRPKRPREDFEYAFVDYGGSNITHWSFLGEEDSINVDRVCSKSVFVKCNRG